MALREIWEIAPHLLGERDWRRFLLVLRVYADESGKGSPIAFVMAGFVARAKEWAEFERDWATVLAMPPAVKAFHMNEVVSRKEFARIKAASEVLRQHQFPAVAITMFADDFDAILKGRIGPRLDTPYFPASQMIMEECLEWQIDHGIDEPMDFVFDEQFGESDFLQSIWTPLLNAMPTELQRRFGQRPIHVDDVKHPPVQAADMLAWSLHRIAFCNAKNQPYDEFLDGIFDGLALRHKLWRREEMAAFLSYVRQRNTALGRLTMHEFEDASQNRDILYWARNRDVIKKAHRGETVRLWSIPAKGIGRFLLVDSCHRAGMPHLHRRSGDECLGEFQV